MLYSQLTFIFVFLLYQIQAVRGSTNLLPDVGNIFDESDGVVRGCIAAFNQTLDCIEHIRFVRHYYQHEWTDRILTSLCTPQCSDSISKWQSDVAAACDKEDLPFIFGGASYKGSVYTQKLRYGLDMVCMKSRDRKSYGDWCQLETRKWHTHLQPSFKNARHDGDKRKEKSLGLPSHETTGILAAYPKSLLCSSCFLDRLGIQATAYSSNWSPALANDYASLGKLCSKTHKKVVRHDGDFVRSSLAVAAPTGTPSAARNMPCNGQVINFQDTDTPLSLSNNFIVSTAEVLHLNGIPLEGANILTPLRKLVPGKSSACMPLSCEVLRVDKGESCEDIIKTAQTTAMLFFSWNPHLLGNCASGLVELQNVCVGPPGGRYDLPTPIFENNPYDFRNLSSTAPGQNSTISRDNSTILSPPSIARPRENAGSFTTMDNFY
ncbi:hypothetical protein TWF718_009844 [Orbilia javanica]|uniref:LysM domain-containing protein n=1 Tax=Orbilia javanica TaxID=47235 RepID=A0AAN8MUB4_9PEZI